MSWSRFLVAGLAAGLLNTLCGIAFAQIAMPEMSESLRTHGLREINQPGDVVPHLVQRLLMGFVTVALYLAIHPRAGGRSQAVLVTTLFVWLLAYVRPFWNHVHIGLFTASLMLKAGAWGALETALTATAAALVLHRFR